jgi:uncharacterized damage-inducible protein DinB
MIWLQSLTTILRRDLGTLRREVEAYPDEALLWAPAPGITNPGGVLVRHLCGNLQHFIGTVLGGSIYRRDREAEFTAPPTSRAALLREIAATETAVSDTLAQLSRESVELPYPIAVGGQTLTTADFLLHLAVHLTFHLGQMDYHRRFVTGMATSVAPVAIPSLVSARPAAATG